MSNGSGFLEVIRVLQTVGAQIRAVRPRKCSGCWNFSIISVIQASKLHISEIFMPECVYLSPNEYSCLQMCIFMTNLIKFSTKGSRHISPEARIFPSSTLGVGALVGA